jgi:hypothetical protein
MKGPEHPDHNASRDSFLKALKREEIYADDYRDMELLGIEEFIERQSVSLTFGTRLPVARGV